MTPDDITIIKHTATGPTALECPLCPWTLEVPPIPVSDQLGAAFGMTGDTLARIHADQAATRAAQEMRAHLATHTPEDWVEFTFLDQEADQ